MKNIDRDFKASHGKSILFLGKIHSLNQDEIKLFLDQFDITYTDTIKDDTLMFVESSMISPLEEDIAYSAVKKGIKAYSSEEFEKLYASKLNDNSILMSLKLSNNQERLSRLLHNPYLSDTLFLKLFNMYDWGEDGLFESSENMEITTLFTKRFYKKERFDPATFHSPISVFEIALISEDSEVLQTLFSVPNLSVKQSRSGIKKPTNIKEALATNQHLNQETIKRLSRVNDKNIDYFLAQNPLLDEDMIKTIFNRSDKDIKLSLASNPNISDEIFEKLLEENSTHEYLLYYQKIDSNRFKMIKNPHPNIGANENLSDDVIKSLIESDDIEVLKLLSENERVDSHHLQTIYKKQNPELLPYLASNKNLPKELIEKLYKQRDTNIDINLALNTNAPIEILDELYNRDNFEINRSLALNESLPISYLQQLQLDTRLMNYLKENRTFTENILNNLGI